LCFDEGGGRTRKKKFAGKVRNSGSDTSWKGGKLEVEGKAETTKKHGKEGKSADEMLSTNHDPEQIRGRGVNDDSLINS